MTAVVLVCDEGAGSGLGHRHRCEAIAKELKSLGFQPVVVTSGRGVMAAPIVVVDSYRFRADDRHCFVPGYVIAIDDLERDLAVDIAVLPAPGATGSAYRNARRVLAGARYSIVDPSLVPARNLATRTPRVLVTMGASDTGGIGARIASECALALPGAEIRLVIGPWGDQSTPSKVTPVFVSNGLAEELNCATVAVTAGGVTLLEAMALGCPTVAIATAPNQRSNVDAAANAGAVRAADVSTAAAITADLMGDESAQVQLSQAGSDLIDAKGASRVAEAIAQLVRVPQGATT